MGIYAEVTDGVITNVVVCDDRKHAKNQGWLLIDRLDPQPGIGWTRDGKKWIKPEPVEWPVTP